MINSGQILEVSEQYYAENLVMLKMGETQRVGKDTNSAFEIGFLNSIEAVHNAGVNNITSDENKAVVMVENWIDLTFKGRQLVNKYVYNNGKASRL